LYSLAIAHGDCLKLLCSLTIGHSGNLKLLYILAKLLCSLAAFLYESFECVFQ
jgi:hypothetical protein